MISGEQMVGNISGEMMKSVRKGAIMGEDLVVQLKLGSLGEKERVLMAVTTCWEMYGNCVRIGSLIIIKKIRNNQSKDC